MTIILIFALMLIIAVIIFGICISDFDEFLSACFVIVGFFSAAVYICVLYNYASSSYKADIINSEYGTSYTQNQIFFADDIIDTIQEIKRDRIEINGNLLKGDICENK